MKIGFLTKEEKLVFLTVSICLIGGGLFQLISSVFELPEALTPPFQNECLSSRDESRKAARCPLESEGTSRNADTEGTVLPASGSSFAYPEDARARDAKDVLPGAKAYDISGKLELNTATTAELEALPGIGPVLAARIVEQRRRTGGFSSVEEILAVRGIGRKTLDKFREWVYVSLRR